MFVHQGNFKQKNCYYSYFHFKAKSGAVCRTLYKVKQQIKYYINP